MDSNALESWPKDSLQHELRSLRLFLALYDKAPEEIRIREIEGAHERPMIQITLLTSGVDNSSQFMFAVNRTLALTYFGSDTEMAETDRHQQAWRVHDWLTEILMRGYGVRGPIIRIYDFSEDAPFPTKEWMEITTATVEVRQDQFGLWTVPVDLRYTVVRDEAEYVDPEPSVTITDYERRVEIQ